MTSLSFGGLLFAIVLLVASLPIWLLAREAYDHFFPQSDDPSDYISGDTESHYWSPVYPRDHPLYREDDEEEGGTK